MKILLALLLFLALNSPVFAAYDSATQATTGPLKLVRMTPEGENVTTLREIVFTFDRDVVPVGRMERTADEIPIHFSPSLDCQWRWLSRNTLGCRLDEAHQLALATTYQVDIQPGIATEDGTTIEKPEARLIATQRPRLNNVSFKTWQAADVPVMRIAFSQPVARSSVKAAITFDPNTPFKVFADESLQEIPAFLKLPGEKNKYLEVTQSPIKGDDQLKQKNEDEFRRNWLVQPEQGLGLDRDVKLTVNPGLISAAGPLPGNEKRGAISFATFPAFRFLGVRCHPISPVASNGDDIITIPPGTELAKQPQCNPLRGAGLEFTTPVITDEIKNNVDIAPSLAGDRKDYDPWANAPRHDFLDAPHSRDRTYTVWFPELLKAMQLYNIAIDNTKIRDQFGALLPDPVHMDFQTSHRAPQYHLQHSQAVLEAGVDSEQPVVVTNLQSLDVHYGTLTAKEGAQGLSKTREIASAQDVAFPMPLGIRDLLQGKSGVVIGNFSTNPAVNHGPWCDSCFMTQVTPWQVHAKIGHFNSTVWVVDFATGKTVSDAKVELFLSSDDKLTGAQTNVATSTTDNDGLATLAGTLDFDPQLNKARNSEKWYIKVTKDQDMALLPLSSHYHVQGYYGEYYWGDGEAAAGNRYPEQKAIYHHIHAWGTTAQGVYRLGDTMQYKIYVRDQDNYKFVAAPNRAYTLTITDPKGNEVATKAGLSLNEFGALDGEFAVAKSAPVGWYQFGLKADFAPHAEWKAMRVLVADFTPAPFRVTSELNADFFKPGDTLKISGHARLHAGGPYVEAKTRFNATLHPGAIKVSEDSLKQFNFDSNAGAVSSITLNETDTTLDNKGMRARFFRWRMPLWLQEVLR